MPSAQFLYIQLPQVVNLDSIDRTVWRLENVLAFAHLVKILAPSANSVTLDLGANAADTHLAQLQHVFMTELLVGVQSAVLTTTYQVAPSLIFPSELTNLAHIAFFGLIQNSVHDELIRRNALVLNSLLLSMSIYYTTFWMYTNIANSLIVYHRLKSLHLLAPPIVMTDAGANTFGMAPFPNLVTLSIFGHYPFSDDVLFRGNAASLRFVTIPYDVLAQNIIGHSDVFTNVRQTRFRRFTVCEATKDESNKEEGRGIDAINTQIGLIAASTSCLVYRPSHTRNGIVRSFLNQPGLDGLQQLELSWKALILEDVIDLVRVLPGLLHLNCKLTKTSTSRNSTAIANKVDQIHARHYPLNIHFRNWTTGRGADVSARHLARSVMLIAVLCPNFSMVRVDQDTRVAFGREVAWAALRTPFDNYATRLLRFMSNMDNEDGEASDAGMDSGSEPDWDRAI
ncbi:hypothetical protein GGH93_005563 [Coemansia aciculifera]|nr:hypothetical protein GGH93_005563 [Coemansia aciculifera]